jgi:hypothetical protein
MYGCGNLEKVEKMKFAFQGLEKEGKPEKADLVLKRWGNPSKE